MSDEKLIEGEVEERRDATKEVLEPEVIPRDDQKPLVDAGRVIMMVGGPQAMRPMSLPQVFQEIFAILGDIDRRLTALEKGERPSGLIIPD